MIYILMVIFANGYGPRMDYKNLGEFHNLAACQRASVAIKETANDVDIGGHIQPKFLCVAKQ